MMRDERHYKYCPICAGIKDLDMNFEETCFQCKVELVISKYPSYYYDEKAIELYNDIGKWGKVLYDEEISKHPLYSKEVDDELFHRMTESAFRNAVSSNNVYTPKCPVCQSPNIKKLSDLNRAVHGLAFGLFSKTARSQWVCGNCGNKW